MTDQRAWSWTCKARDRSNQPCGAELGIVTGGRLCVRVGLVVEVGTEGVTVTCPASFRHHRTWRIRPAKAA